MKIFVFDDDEIKGSKYIVVSKIDSYGLNACEFNADTGNATRAIVWVSVGQISHNINLSYIKALELIESIGEAIEYE